MNIFLLIIIILGLNIVILSETGNILRVKINFILEFSYLIDRSNVTTT